jgi:cellulose synthase/poly-beta-1,6-N-acetylglucosamine synthase-like glycosyltransferase
MPQKVIDMCNTSANRITVTAAVPSVGRPEILKNCLQGLASQTVPADNILVICRPEDTATQSTARKYGAEVVLVTRPGVALAVQTAVQMATTDLLCFTDDDAVPPKDWISRVLTTFSLDTQLGVLGGRDILPTMVTQSCGSFPRVGLLHLGKMHGNHHLGLGQPRVADYPKGVNMAFRVTAINKVALTDLVVGSGAQVGYEVILGFAAKRAGYKVMYDPHLTVKHFPAERPAQDDRRALSWQKVYERAHNRMIALVAYGKMHDAILHSLHTLTLGDRMNPGVLKFLALLLSDTRNASTRYFATVSGLILAWRTGLTYRNKHMSIIGDKAGPAN